jgi:TusA-related sulfurtransferase
VLKPIGIIFVVASLSTLGCKKDPPADATPAPSAPIVAVVDASVAPATIAVAAAGKMAHCPSTVTGATTDIKDSADGVTITVTSADAVQTADIRARAKFLAEAAKNIPDGKQHNGSGEGGGVYGRCPVIMRNTLVDVSEVAGGVKMDVKPKDPKERDWLRREARDRNAELALPGASAASGAGQGKMGHCPSAVLNATTTVKDTKDGVQVDVVGKDEATTKDIRDRSKLLVAAAKLETENVAHKGDGSGGGGLGRCPVVLTGTTVEAKDIPGGASFFVKPAKPADAVSLRKESRDRAANFVASK